MKIKNKENCISFSIIYDNEKRMQALKIQSKTQFKVKYENNSQLFEFRFPHWCKISIFENQKSIVFSVF